MMIMITIEDLKRQISITYSVQCKLCGEKIEDETEEGVGKKLANHVDKQCNVAKFMKYAQSKGCKTMADMLKLMELAQSKP